MGSVQQTVAEIIDATFAEAVEEGDRLELAKRIAQVMPKCEMPNPGEASAISWEKPMTAALCFDRVWSPSELITPDGIRFFTGSREEVWAITISHLLGMTRDLAGEDRKLYYLAKWQQVLHSYGGWNGVDAQAFCDGSLFTKITGHAQRRISESVSDVLGRRVPPIYSTPGAFHGEYHPGAADAIVATLVDLDIVDEAQLSWEQILQFRGDTEARRKYMSLVHWLDREMAGKSAEFIRDEVAVRLSQYEWALRKHGIKTVLGALSAMLDSRAFLGGVLSGFILAWHGQPAAGLLTGLGVAGARCAIELAKSAVDLEDIHRGQAAEIAYVYDVRRTMGGG